MSAKTALEDKLAEMQGGVDAGKSLDAVTAEAKANTLAKREASDMKLAEGIGGFDWRNVPPPAMAQILIRKPFSGAKRDDPPYYLKVDQALYFAMRCYDLGVSPLGAEAWFDPVKWVVNLTAEGQRRVARNLGLNLGPPRYERLVRPWPVTKQPIPINGKAVAEDFGYTCKMDVNGRGDVSYTAWFSEWFRPTPIWREQSDHMLQVRAQDHAIEFATGVGMSNPIVEQDAPVELPRPMPQIEVQTVDIKPE
jgi:hypothetical protein